MERITYLGQPNCYRLSNGTVEVVVTTDIGPRIIRYGFVGRENVFGECPDLVTPTPWGDWKPWGGHRLWIAPEDMPRSYAPDDTPVEHERVGPQSIRMVAPTDRAGFQKAISVELGARTHVTVHHRVTNRGAAPVTVAAWALTVVRSGGVSVLPLEPYRSHDDYLLPAQPLVRWYFTDLSDPRWTFGRRFIRLASNTRRPAPQKIGLLNTQGWCAHHCAGTLFVKRFETSENANLPDYGCNNEAYTAGSFMEIETLGALTDLAPGQSVDHVERWQLFSDVDIGQTEETLERAIMPLLVVTPARGAS